MELPRILPRPLNHLFVGSVLAAAYALPAAANPIQQNVPSTSVQGGVTIQNSFYDYLSEELKSQNLGRTAFKSYDPFSNEMDGVQERFDTVNNIAQWAFENNVSILGFWADLASGSFYNAALTLAIIIGCDSPQLYFSINVVPESDSGHFTVEGIEFLPRMGAHDLDFTLTDVGLVFLTDVQFGIGTCDIIDKTAKTQVVFRSLDYRVTADLSSHPATFSATLLTDLKDADVDLTIEGVSSSLFGSGLADAILSRIEDHTNLIDVLEEFSETEIPMQLTEVTDDWWGRYLPGAGSMLDVSAASQNSSYAQNGVNGPIDSAAHLTLGTSTSGDRVHSTFAQGHSTVIADAQAEDATGTFVGSFTGADFAAENTAVDGTFHLAEAALRHSVLAGLHSAVGLRSGDKDNGFASLVIDHSFQNLAPSHGGQTVEYLLTDSASSILPVPLSTPQINSLVAGAGTSNLHSLALTMEVSEVLSVYELPAFGSSPYGLATQNVLIDVRIMSGAAPVFEETLDCVFTTPVTFGHDRMTNSNSFNGLHSTLVYMANENGIEADEISGSTMFSDAPVLLFLRAFFSDRNVNPNFMESRAMALVEGLAGPLVGRATQEFLRLPGMDMAKFAGSYGISANDFYDSCFANGLMFDVPHQCAEIQNWGTRNGVPYSGTNDRTVVVDVNWNPVEALEPTLMTTSVVAQGIGGGGIGVPSITDSAYAQFLYEPQPAGNESRGLYSSGLRMLPFLEGNGIHYVCATAIGYEALLPILAANPRATAEIVPYTGFDGSIRDCTSLVLSNPVGTEMHHADTDYMAVAFESRLSCVGPGMCDGTRVGMYWKAPLQPECGKADDHYKFDMAASTVRLGPDSYNINPEACGGGSGGGPGNAVGSGFD